MYIYIPLVVDRLDDEAQCGTDAVDVLGHDVFYDGGLASVVEAEH